MTDSDRVPDGGESQLEWKTHKYQDRIPLWGQLSFRNRRKIKRYAQNALTATAVLIIAFPVFWMWSTALRPQSLMYAQPAPLLPTELTLEHYRAVLFTRDIPLYYFNSLVVAFGVVSLTVTASTLSGYGLSRLDLPFKKIFARGILFGYMFPSILLAIPLFIFWRELGIINSRIGIILAETAKTLPFAIWLMWRFFEAVPESLEESAMMAGATRFRAFYEIALPQAKPGIIAVAVLAYAMSWDEFTIPKVLGPEQGVWVLTVGLDALIQQSTVLWRPVMAASSLILIPSFLFIFFLQKYMLTGFRL
jgi:multiple sugar transport system permease protein